MIAVARWITARKLAVGVRLTTQAEPAAVTKVHHETDGQVRAWFDNGINIRFTPGQRLELAPAGGTRKGN